MTLFKQFFPDSPKLIIGENSALYINGKEEVILQSPGDISKLKNKSSLDVFIDFSGADYKVYKYPKLSRFELKQSLQNHPDLQDQTLLGAEAFMTEQGDLNLCTYKNTPHLSRWLEALSIHEIPLKKIKNLPFLQGILKDHRTKKSTYWIAKAQEQKARHICLINGAIIFVRYTDLKDNIIDLEIQKTLQFIQRDYALESSEITLINDLKKPPFLETKATVKTFHWQWLERLPESIFKGLKKRQQQNYLETFTKVARHGSLAVLGLAGLLFVTEGTLYFTAHNNHKNILEFYKNLPLSLQELPPQKIQQILFLEDNNQDPFDAISTLQEQEGSTFKLEELNWQTNPQKIQQLRLSIRRDKQHGLQDHLDHLETIFHTFPKALSSDQLVHRVELILTKGDMK